MSEVMKSLEELHCCEKCQGKIVAIRCDMLGNTYCSYCNEKVDYSSWAKELGKRLAGEQK